MLSCFRRIHGRKDVWVLQATIFKGFWSVLWFALKYLSAHHRSVVWIVLKFAQHVLNVLKHYKNEIPDRQIVYCRKYVSPFMCKECPRNLAKVLLCLWCDTIIVEYNNDHAKFCGFRRFHCKVDDCDLTVPICKLMMFCFEKIHDEFSNCIVNRKWRRQK